MSNTDWMDDIARRKRAESEQQRTKDARILLNARIIEERAPRYFSELKRDVKAAIEVFCRQNAPGTPLVFRESDETFHCAKGDMPVVSVELYFSDTGLIRCSYDTSVSGSFFRETIDYQLRVDDESRLYLEREGRAVINPVRAIAEPVIERVRVTGV